MNGFIWVAGVLYVAGSLHEFVRGNYGLAAIFACYAVANFILAYMGKGV